MFLRVWPDKPLEGVYFEVSFKDNLGSDVDVPQTWLNQLQCAIQSGLEPPQSALAFDKSVWAVCLLQIVHFKMAEQLVSCIFIDGTQIDFPLRCNHAARLLYTIIADSREAMEATRMEQVRDAALMRSKRASSPMMRPLSPVKPTTTSKHRKHRSLLVSLISSFIPSSAPSPSGSGSGPSSIPDLERPEHIPIPPAPRIPSRVLKRRARATIVDVFRRYVIPELPSPQPFGGYCYWIADSMLRRSERRMRQIVQECGGFVPGPGMMQYRVVHSMSSPLPSPTPTTPSAVDDDSSAETTDTDGSSVHPPQDLWIEHVPVASQQQQQQQNVPNTRVRTNSGATFPFYPRGPTTSPPVGSYFAQTAHPPSPASSPNLHDHFTKMDPATEYAILHTAALRYRAAMCRAEAAERASSMDQDAQLERLEIKSRRRAWSSRALLDRAPVRFAGLLGRPVWSSPLAWGRVMTREMVEAEAAATAAAAAMVSASARVGAAVAARRMTVPRKFGVAVAAKRLSVVLEGERDVEAVVPTDVKPDEDSVRDVIDISSSQAPLETIIARSTTTTAPPPPAYFAQTMQPFPCFDYAYSDEQESEHDSDQDPHRDFISEEDSSTTCVNSTVAHSDVVTVPIPIGMFDASALDPSSEKFCAEFEVRVDVSTAVYRASGKGECDEEVWLTGTGANGRGIPIMECP